MRRFEFKEGNSNKFWEVTVSENTLTVRFGRVGSAGQEKLKAFANPALAQKEQDKLIAEKQAKGYKEVAPSSSAKDGPRRSSRPASFQIYLHASTNGSP